MKVGGGGNVVFGLRKSSGVAFVVTCVEKMEDSRGAVTYVAN